jgi:riboflavin synthase
MEIDAPAELRRYLVEKGSIAVDGVSLTIASITPEGFTVWLIPHTRAVTTLGQRVVGDLVNLECDLLGKYVERMLQAHLASGRS